MLRGAQDGTDLAIPNDMARIDQYFKFMKEQGASDLHLTTGNPPILRIHGEMVRVEAATFSGDDLKALVYEIAPEHKIKQFGSTRFSTAMTAAY